MTEAVKANDDKPVDPVWVEDQCARFDQVLGVFTAEMREEFRRRAMKGRAHWEESDQVHGMWLRSVELLAKTSRASGNEAAVANYMAFLFMHRTQQIGTVTHGVRVVEPVAEPIEATIPVQEQDDPNAVHFYAPGIVGVFCGYALPDGFYKQSRLKTGVTCRACIAGLLKEVN